MSLVGTRPPTVDEWDKYELHHRARLATKPGLTGMWQVSGRSNITDFEEVVKLDSNKSEILLSTENKLKEIYEAFPNEGKVVLGYSYLVSWNYVTWLDFPRPIDEELIPLFKKWMYRYE